MFLFRNLTAGVILLSAAATAQAEVTAEDVRADIFAMLSQPGVTYSVGADTRAGDTLVLKDITLDLASPDGETGGKVVVDWIRLREIEGGKVDVTYDPEIVGLFHGTDAESGKPVSWQMTIAHLGTTITVSGDKNERRYRSEEDSFDVTIDDMKIGDAPVPFLFTLTRRGNTSDSIIRPNDPGGHDIDSTTITKKIAWNGTFADTEGNKAAIRGGMDNVHMTLHGRFVPFEEGENPFDKGMELALYVEADSSNMDVTAFSSENGDSTISFREGTSFFDFGLDKEAFRLAAATREIEIGVTAKDLPFPVSLTLGKYTLEARLPFTPDSAGSPYKFALGLEELALGPQVMDMLDPQKIMPRDPTTLRLAISGLMRWLVDPMDPKAIQDFEGPTPVLVETLSLDELYLKAVGAMLRGSGLLSFDNSMVAAGGPPMPEGKLSFEMEGIYGTIDRLRQMGVLTDDQAMGVLAMLGVFARPAGEGDKLVSEVEFTAGGGIVVNGQSLK